MNTKWSQKVVERFDLQLPRDLRIWLDDDVWQQTSGAEFRFPIHPDQLVAPPSEMLWAGFMLPDTLPLIGNEYGDWLCLRVDPQGAIPEVVYWCHGGGDWIPYGRSLAEALVYDVVFYITHPQRPELAELDPDQDHLYELAEWAYPLLSDQQRECLPKFWEQAIPRIELLTSLVDADVAQIAARRDIIHLYLDHILKEQCDPNTAIKLGAPWEPDFVSWLFDTALLPETRRRELSEYFERPIGELTEQNWKAAEQQAMLVAQERQDLGWAMDIAGWAAERDQRLEEAVQRYLAGSRASTFADDTVRFRTHWFSDGLGKFSTARLADLREHLTTEMSEDPYLQLFWDDDSDSLRARVCDHWLRAAKRAELDHQYGEAYRCYYNAGWDVGLQSIAKYGPILEGLIRSAKRAGWNSLAKVAQLHHQCLTAT